MCHWYAMRYVYRRADRLLMAPTQSMGAVSSNNDIRALNRTTAAWGSFCEHLAEPSHRQERRICHLSRASTASMGRLFTSSKMMPESCRGLEGEPGPWHGLVPLLAFDFTLRARKSMLRCAETAGHDYYSCQPLN